MLRAIVDSHPRGSRQVPASGGWGKVCGRQAVHAGTGTYEKGCGGSASGLSFAE